AANANSRPPGGFGCRPHFWRGGASARARAAWPTSYRLGCSNRRATSANFKFPSDPVRNLMNLNRVFILTLLSAWATCGIAQTSGNQSQQTQKSISLPTSKSLQEPVPGAPRRTNSLPVTAALRPDGKYLALLNNGFGSAESDYRQSIAVLDLEKNQLRDFPDARQAYFVGLAWSGDGSELYASVASLTDPDGKKGGSTGNGIAVYRFADGA